MMAARAPGNGSTDGVMAAPMVFTAAVVPSVVLVVVVAATYGGAVVV